MHACVVCVSTYRVLRTGTVICNLYGVRSSGDEEDGDVVVPGFNARIDADDPTIRLSVTRCPDSKADAIRYRYSVLGRDQMSSGTGNLVDEA